MQKVAQDNIDKTIGPTQAKRFNLKLFMAPVQVIQMYAVGVGNRFAGSVPGKFLKLNT
jgi:hypothetical protein